MKNKNKKGFTLIEVIVASLLLIVCMVGVMDAFVAGASFRQSAQNTATALFMAQDLMEIALKTPDITGIEGQCPTPYEGFKYKITVKNTAGSDTLRQINVSVSSPAGKFSKTVELTALKSSLGY